MKKGFKKHYISVTEEKCNKTFIISSILEHAETQGESWAGYWDGMQWNGKTFYCNEDGLKAIKEAIKNGAGLGESLEEIVTLD